MNPTRARVLLGSILILAAALRFTGLGWGLRHRPDLEPVGLPAPDGTAERFRLWPHLHRSDGMFVAGFRKRP